jgi:hypothetical protein
MSSLLSFLLNEKCLTTLFPARPSSLGPSELEHSQLSFKILLRKGRVAHI